jgi:primosomal replication protein N
MMSETQIHTIARQMLERHGPSAIAHAAQNALSCEHKGQTDEATEWRHVKDAMRIMNGPHQS